MTRRIVALLGAPGSGKGVARRFLVAKGFVELGILTPADLMLQVGLGIGPELLHGDAQRIPLPEFHGRTPAEMRKALAKEWGRYRVGDDVWCTAWRRLARCERRDIVLCDAGFPNEVAAVRAEGGVVWRIGGEDARATRAWDRHEAGILADLTIPGGEGLERRMETALSAWMAASAA